MTQRERVLAAIAHQKTDRAPANYGAHKEVTDKLIERLGVKDREELLRAFGVEMRRIGFSYGQPDSAPDERGIIRNMWGLKYYPQDLPASVHRPTDTGSPFDEQTTVDEIYRHPWPSADALDYSTVKPQIESYDNSVALFGGPWCPFFHEVGWLIGEEQFYIWMLTKPAEADAIIDCIVTYEIEAAKRFFKECAGRLDIYYIGNDFGSQRGLTISPEMWRRFIRKPLKRYFDLAHDFGCKVMLHSCGSVRAIIKDLIEDGLDMLDPIQIRAAGMDMPSLVRDFGDKLCFHGGVDTQHTLPFCGAEEVRSLVRGFRDLTRDTGGYVMTGSQELIEDIPLDNILAMYDENLRAG